MVPTLAGSTTLLVQSAGYQCITPQPQPVAGFDPGKDLKPLGHPIDTPQLMVVRSNFPANAFAEFLQYAKANPGKVNYASSSNGPLQHGSTELLKDLAKTYLVHIPYRGTGQALTDLLGDTVDFSITTPPPCKPFRWWPLPGSPSTARTASPTKHQRGFPAPSSRW